MKSFGKSVGAEAGAAVSSGGARLGEEGGGADAKGSKLADGR